VAEGLARLRNANRWMIGALIGALMATGLLVGAGSGQAS
jgi:hypothetical protein